ncbi:flavin-containing monooxygenase [Metabacillus fastidiosus]|uniref:NAD(P)/FAD-dependent oxidoreductase n=1 Tax=Metabacillus fastidiosus TaxID=1458 RepID=A0ABU6NZB4_9BACI|nr:NAD(P)/FAD-dependent oxidoreductase [Metabacillus fastidiosus]MED4402456.1 NAD(P)/FAD-dependent oxidoreductase [Metabacillus fastidiosus]MED4461743.1 NAD(P)/FAD-dependent oxidoreductase [Metabacillus fastidiosus]
MTKVWDVIVIGGGQAGLAVGYYLQKKGLNFLILESKEKAGGSWPQYYDSLKLFSPARFSSLPGLKFPVDPNKYPSKLEVIQYLEIYQKKFKLPILTNSKVISVERKENKFSIITTLGETHQSLSIINATGSFLTPYIPEIKGMDSFNGKVIHSSEYRNTDSFINERVIVVGSRNSAVQIAVELANVSSTTLAVRHPVKLINQKIFGKDLHFWLRIIGFDSFPFRKFGKSVPISDAVINSDRFEVPLSEGKPNQKKMFTSFYSDGVVWSDGEKERVDSIIFATGFRNDFPYLINIGALDDNGNPLHLAGESKSVPGLYYVGLEGQRSFSSATLRGVGRDASYIVQKLTKHLKNNN